MYGMIKQHLQHELGAIRDAGLYKSERIIDSPQNTRISVPPGGPVLNMCANNYLGLAQHPDVNSAAQQGLKEWGYGMASVRFICGTQTIHKQLENRLSEFLGTEDTILYPSCFDANGGLFETILGPEDAVISDELNHASIIDGIRLCKANRFRYKNNDMEDLENQLENAEAADTRFKLITTDGVFSMDGYIAQLDRICDLAEKYEAMVHFDDCHATGFIGDHGRGTHEYRNCMDRIDLVTGTLGKALGGGQWRLYQWQKRNHRNAAAALPPLFIFQYSGASRGYRSHQSTGPPHRIHGTTGSIDQQCTILQKRPE